MLSAIRRWFDGPTPAFDDRWHRLLEAEFEHWRLLDQAELARMERLVASFVQRTRWEAANGFQLDEEIEVLIAAQASMLLLGLDLDEYPQLTSVIVHP